jgi:siroheme decarboxylase
VRQLDYELDTIDRRLLNRLQAGVPLVRRPFAALGEALELEEDEVLQRVDRLKDCGVIRQVSAIFDSRALGYQSTLVAARVEDNRLDAAAAVVSGHPGVSHNYAREHAFNLWYTLAVPGDSAFGLEGTLQRLHQFSGAISTRMLPTVRMFKIGVKLDMTGEGDIENGKWKVEKGGMAGGVSAADKMMIRVLQQDLPVIGEPYIEWSRQAGVSDEELLSAARDFLERGVMRRFAAVLRHRDAGFGANAMGVWVVPESAAESFGRAAAAFNEVSHCYQRKAYPDWPYTMFTMVHGKTRDECQRILSEIAAATGGWEYAALYSTKEYKKVRVRYFTPEIEAWERAHG